MKIYTRKGDDGTTGLLYGGRVRKDAPGPTAYGDVDEAQSSIGLARAHCRAGGELDQLLISIERDLWVLMADLATDSENRDKLTAGVSLVTEPMVKRLEDLMPVAPEDALAEGPGPELVDVAKRVPRSGVLGEG